MDKNKIVIIISVIVVAGIVGGYFWMNASKKEIVVPVEEPKETVTPVQKALSDTMKEYQDQAGFSFSYPDNLVIAPKETDKNTYSLLEITSPDATGSVTITVTDSTFKTLADWTKKNKATDSAEIADTSLADLEAKEVKTDDLTTLVAIDKGGVLFNIMVEPKGQNELWQKVYEKIVSSFVFVSPDEQSQSSSGQVITEEEEVVE